MNSVQAARVRKTRQYMADRAAFMAQLVEDLEGFAAYCKRKGVKPCVRLNGTSDIMWEKGHPVTRIMPCPILDGSTVPVRYPSLMAAFPEVQFYDYTKIYTRVDKVLPANYALTLSYSEANPSFAAEVLARVEAGKANMAVVFRDLFTVGHYMGAGFKGRPVIDGDKTDMRFLDPQGGNVVALYAKGKAKQDESGFVIN
jgi:hypothetical protein